MKKLRRSLPVLFGAAAAVCFAQPNRILSPVDKTQAVILAGHISPHATPANDVGPVASSRRIPYITMMLKPTAAQQADLDQLLQDQQNPSSPNFHRWLTPEQYADRFGVSASDTAKIAAWLQSQGFTVNPVSRSRTFLTFSGTAGQLASAFGTAIHQYRVNGQSHFANATDPQVPAALAPLVTGFRGLSDFRLKARVKARPHWTNPPAIAGSNFALAPDDFATIYDVAAMYAQNINGSGVTIVIPGQTELYRGGNDTTSFWSQYGISAKLAMTEVPGYPPDPLFSASGDMDESSLDTQWSGAVARGATIQFVYSGDAWSSAVYAVDNSLGQVLSISYGMCEQGEGLPLLPGFRQTVQQANSEGITFLAAAGDTGAADCDDYGVTVAEGGLAVDQPGSFPEVISMGGTQISSDPSYWNTNNTSTDESAKSYLSGEESVWNETDLSLSFGGGLAAGGGGTSSFFPQPVWQNGIAPNDGWRHVPDLVFNSSVFNVPYVVYCGSFDDCFDESGGMEFLGGTSGAAPTMAGVVALLNQFANTKGLGNISPQIYALSKTAPSAFHQITTGNNMVPCAAGSPGCGGNLQEGYSAAPGYNQASGLGSLDVANFIQQWHVAAPTTAIVVPGLDQDPVFQGTSESCGNPSQWNFQLTLAEEAGIAATVANVTINGTDVTSQITSALGSSIPARGSISGCYSISDVSAPATETFAFSGVDANGNHWSTSLSVSFQGALAPLTVTGAANAASYQTTFAPGMWVALFGTGLATTSQATETIPMPLYMAGFTAYMCPINCNNGEFYPVPLWYVGAGQVDFQIPYEITGGRAQLLLTTPYVPLTSPLTYNMTISRTAPGIFTLPSSTMVANGVSTSASPGQVFTVYITGQGAVTPAVDDGFSPSTDGLSETPVPTAAVSVTVGGVAVSQTDGNWFVGIPSWSVGVTQINFTIPAGVGTGKQQVVVTVGGVASSPATVTIQ